MLTLANVIWGARCGKSARRVLLGETRSRGYAYSVRRRRESAYLREAPHGLPSSRLVSTIPLDLWVQQWRGRHAHGDGIIGRYCDDFLVGFQHDCDAQRFLHDLCERLARFKLELHPEKTRLVAFGRFARERHQEKGISGAPPTFNFLGFTHCCGRSRDGKFMLVRRTM